MDDFTSLLTQVSQRAKAAGSLDAVAALRSELLGRSGPISVALKGLGRLPPEERRAQGEAANSAKSKIEALLASTEEKLAAKKPKKGTSSACDITLVGRRVAGGFPHPLRLIEQRVLDVLSQLGFRIAHGPLVEHTWFNFDALNMPADHPARDMQDTFFVDDEVVLRTHTSNVQVRQMVQGPPPIRVAAPGMVFRHDEVDATHTPVFHQIEGLWVDSQATLADLRGVLRAFLRHLFGSDAQMRFRPSYFPFTEPSVEVDVSCIACQRHADRKKTGSCPTCKDTGWLEVLGAGMVHPSVLMAVGYDPERTQGFAFGMGLERAAMLAYGLGDIRALYENDMRMLEQFSSQLRHAEMALPSDA